MSTTDIQNIFMLFISIPSITFRKKLSLEITKFISIYPKNEQKIKTESFKNNITKIIFIIYYHHFIKYIITKEKHFMCKNRTKKRTEEAKKNAVCNKFKF